MEQFGHPNRVLFDISEKKAIELGEKLNADKIIVQVGICLMDIKLGQAIVENRLAQHVQMGVEAAKVFLDKFKIDEISKEKIINCIEAHHNDVPYTCIEAEICANADCYRFISPKGVFISLISASKRYDKFEDCLNWVEMKMDEKYNILSLDICKQELEGYYQTLKKYIADARSL